MYRALFKFEENGDMLARPRVTSGVRGVNGSGLLDILISSGWSACESRLGMGEDGDGDV